MAIEGILLVDKPAGMTSHDVVGVVRRALGTRKVGHAGTLDPLATGLLVLGVGRATRLLRFLGDLPKTYEGTGVLGVRTTTLDGEGEVTATAPVQVSREDEGGGGAEDDGTAERVTAETSGGRTAGTARVSEGRWLDQLYRVWVDQVTRAGADQPLDPDGWCDGQGAHEQHCGWPTPSSGVRGGRGVPGWRRCTGSASGRGTGPALT